MGYVRRISVFAMTWIWVLGLHAVAWAQEEVPAEPAAKGYVAQYSLILLLVGLGIMAVCRPSRRAEAAGPHQKAV